MVQALNLPKELFGNTLIADATLEGISSQVTPRFGKLLVEIGEYMDHEGFVVSEMAPYDSQSRNTRA